MEEPGTDRTGVFRNIPKELQVIVAHCNLHGRRKFVDVAHEPGNPISEISGPQAAKAAGSEGNARRSTSGHDLADALGGSCPHP